MVHIKQVLVLMWFHCIYNPGAGKTTTFSMLTGDISATRGTAFISGFDIRTDLRKVERRHLT